MRRPTGSLVLATVALIAAVVAGCGATEPLPSATPIASDGAVDAGPSGGATTSGLSAFEGHVREATASEGQLVRELGAASAGTGAALRAVIAKMRAWAQGEHDWLAGHPADPCYDAAATKLGAALDAMTSSADWLSGMVDASFAPSDDVSRGSMGTEAANDLGDATQALADAAALAKAARTRCG